MESKAVWSQRGNCYGDLTFDIFKRGSKKTCTGCPVSSQCRSYALVHREKGMWGGQSEYQRSKVALEIVDVLRSVFREAGLLEDRPGLLATQELSVKQQQVQTFPNVQQVA